MKKIGTTENGALIEIGADDLVELKHIVRNRVTQFVDLLLDGLLEAAGIVTAATPVTRTGAHAQSGELKPGKREIKPGKCEILKSVKPKSGSEVYRRCEQCDARLPAGSAPQRRFCDVCVKARKDACPSAQKRKAPTHGGTRTATCAKCNQPFAARVFGPIPHHCPACQPGGKQTTAAAQSPALQTPPKALRPAMPSDDTGKAARLEQIRRLALRDARELADDVIEGAQA